MQKCAKSFFLFLSFVIVTIIFPFLISTIFHFDYITNYSAGDFNLYQFFYTYYSGIYKYRILGREIFLQIYCLVHTLNMHGIVIHHINNTTLRHLGRGTDPIFYLTQYIFDTIFLIFTAIGLFFLFCQKTYQLEGSYKNTIILTILFIITMTQYVATVYDNLFYWILVSSLFFIFKDIYDDNRFAFFGIAITLILGVMTIEHAALILSAYATAYIDKYGLRFKKKPFCKLLLLFLLFFIVYLSLRAIYGASHGVFDVLAFSLNLKFLYLTVCSLLFLIAGCFLTANHSEQLKRICIFLFFALPYIAAIFSFAYLAEIRVWVPVIMLAICFAALKPRKQLRA